jgi:D-threo-aldose 1-dehydrogenase
LLAECAERGIAVVAAAPFNSGLLARERPDAGALFDYAPPPPRLLARARELADIAERAGTVLPEAAVQFPLRHPAVASVVCGMRTADQVRSTLRRFAGPITEQAWTELGG